jgi:hypothetical protein
VRSPGAPLVATLLLLLALISGCGGERVFTADEFVEAVNAEGAEISLGDVITTNQEGIEVRAITLGRTDVSPTGAAGEPGASGAMLVLADDGAAREELSRCESAPAFTCFRAANVVLRFEDIFPEEQVRLSEAFQAIASG